MDLKNHIRQIPDFPRSGINFFDISTLLNNPEVWSTAITELAKAVGPRRPDILAGIEARGFLVAASLAIVLNCGVVMIRKSGKLPGKVRSHEYALEYGTDIIEIQDDGVSVGQRVLLVDDLLATGGTLAAADTLLKTLGAEVVGAACIIELSFLNGRDKVQLPCDVLVSYDSE